jgi:sulfur-oxidizing protein SoxX
MNKKTPNYLPLAFAALLLTTGPALSADQAAVDYAQMTPQELAEYLIFESNGFKLDAETQEGGTAKERMTQDDLQRVCTETRNKPSPEQAGKILADARTSIKYPEGGIKLGDWKKGRELAWSGFGFRIGAKPDNHSKRAPGGTCYNCHQLATDRQGGTLGPSLTGYGKTRGTDEQTLRFVYDMIYNAHTYFPCTRMPRFGYKGIINQEQIADIMAYMLDPQSPVNH